MMGCCVGGSKPPLIPPWAARGRDNLLFAERRGRVQAKRRTQGMHENWTDSRLSKPPCIPLGHQGGGFSDCPLDIKGEGQPPLRGAKGTRASEAPHAGDARKLDG